MKSVGRYRIERELARGGAGVVYRARDPDSGETVAVKVLLAGRESRPEARRRFRREAEALSRLEHPHIVGVREVGEEGGVPYLVMDFVAGDTLQRALDTAGALDPRRAARLCQQLAEALAHAHQHGVLHRDLKPSNVLLDGEGNTRLTDFGLTRELAPSASYTRLSHTGQLLGTPGYWPPEQAKGELDRIGPHSDVYGVGATLYALLTGVPPHQGQSLVDLLSRLEHPPTPPRRLRPEVPPGLEAICLRCLSVSPAGRYPTANALAEALREWLRPRSDPQPPKRLAALAVAIVSVGALAALGVILTRTRPEPTSGSPAPYVRTAEVAALVREGLLRQERELGAKALLEPFEQALSLAPDDPAALAGRAAARLLHQLPGGQEDLRRARSSGGEDLLAMPSLASATQLLGQDPRPYLEAWARLDPSAPEPLILRASYLPREEAQALLDEAIELAPGRSLPWLARALQHLDVDVESAERDVQAALERDPQSPRVHAVAAMIAFQRGRDPAGEAHLDHALELAPDSWGLLVQRAQQLLRTGRAAQAIPDLERVTRLQPQRVAGWSQLGRCKLEVGDLEGALAAIERCIELEPTHPNARSGRALILYKLRRLEEALAEAEAVLALDPTQTMCLRVRGICLYQRGDLSGSLADFREVARITRTRGELGREPFVEALEYQRRAISGLGLDETSTVEEACRRGEILLSVSRPAEAIPWYQRAVELDPGSARARAGLGHAMVQAGDPRGREELTAARELDGAGFWSRLQELGLMTHQGEDEAARPLLDRLIEDYPDRGPARRLRAARRFASGDREGAIEDLAVAARDSTDPLLGVALCLRASLSDDLPGMRAAADRLPDHPAVLAQAGTYHQRAGRFEEALAFFSRSLELDPSLQILYRDRATCAAALDRLDEAEHDALDATLLDPSDAIAWYTLGDVQRRLGKHKDAGFSLGKAILYDEGHLETWISLTELSLATGRVETALGESAQAVALAPRDPVARLTRARALAEAGRTAEALTEMLHVRGLEGVSPEVLEAIDRMEQRLGR